jgi:hypothetical protein
MNSGRFVGRNQLIDRLADQVGSRQLAIDILKKRGHLEQDGETLTELGMLRDMMTAEERAIDRKSKKTGLPPESFSYNHGSNKAINNTGFLP